MIILRQKEFARRDYEGLTEGQAGALRQQRAQLARKARAARARLNEAHSHEGWTGNNSRVNFEFDLNGNSKRTKSTYNHPLSLKEIKEQQNWDRKIQNEHLLDEIKAEKENIKEGVKKIGQPKKLNSESQQTQKTIGGVVNKAKGAWSKLGKGGKAAVIGVPVAVAAIGTGMAIKNKKKKEGK